MPHPNGEPAFCFLSRIIYEFSDNGLRAVDHHDTEHYRITRAFLNRPEQLLKHLFEY